MKTEVRIVDRGRGPQFSTGRITVQDLVPYLRQKLTHAQILEIMPALTVEEIEAVERYVRENYEVVMEQDGRIRERNADRRNPPEAEKALRRGGDKMAALREEFKRRKQPPGANGDLAAG
jgi:uncharacterized protein (DUF433 family)